MAVAARRYSSSRSSVILSYSGTCGSFLLAAIRKVAGFLFGLLLFCSHGIQLRVVENDLERIIPAQIRVFFEDCADLILQVLGNLDCTLLKLALHFLEFFSQFIAAMECLVHLAEQPLLWDDLLESVLLQLALDHCDQRIAGHGVQFDALIEQDPDLRVRSAILN